MEGRREGGREGKRDGKVGKLEPVMTETRANDGQVQPYINTCLHIYSGFHKSVFIFPPSLLPSLGPSLGYQSSWPMQFWMVFLRGLKQNKRNKFALAVKVLSNVFFALVLGAIYSKREG